MCAFAPSRPATMLVLFRMSIRSGESMPVHAVWLVLAEGATSGRIVDVRLEEGVGSAKVANV